MENKREIIKAIEDLYNMTLRFDGNLVIEIGRFNGEFVRSETTEPTHVLIHYKDQSPQFGYIQSIECDSGYGIIEDINRAINKFA